MLIEHWVLMGILKHCLWEFPHNGVLWIQQILFIMQGVCVVLRKEETEGLCLVTSFAEGSPTKISLRE